MEDQQNPQGNQSNLNPPTPPSNLPLTGENRSGSDNSNKPIPLPPPVVPPAPVAPPVPSSGPSPEQDSKNEEASNKTDHISPEFQSTIRTMASDTMAISQGGGISGEMIKRKAEGDLPVQKEEDPKPVAPAPEIDKKPLVSLGEMEKARNLPSQKISIPSPMDDKQGIDQNNGNKIEIPEPKKSGSLMKILLIFILLLAIGGGAYWFFVVRDDSPVAVESPTPTPMPTPDIPVEAVVIPVSGPPIDGLVSNIRSKSISPKNIDLVNLYSSSGAQYNFEKLMQQFLFSPPSELITNLFVSEPLSFVLYGQTENFNKETKISYGFVVRVNSSIDMEDTLKQWEAGSLSSDIGPLFDINLSNSSSTEFKSNTHLNTAIRFRNFANPDSTIDYAVIEANDGNIYLAMTNSKESMFAVIDYFKLSPTPTLTPSATPTSSPSASGTPVPVN